MAFEFENVIHEGKTIGCVRRLSWFRVEGILYSAHPRWDQSVGVFNKRSKARKAVLESYLLKISAE